MFSLPVFALQAFFSYGSCDVNHCTGLPIRKRRENEELLTKDVSISGENKGLFP